MYPVGSTSFTPLSCTGLWEAVTIRPVVAPVLRARAAISRPHLRNTPHSSASVPNVPTISWMDNLARLQAMKCRYKNSKRKDQYTASKRRNCGVKQSVLAALPGRARAGWCAQGARTGKPWTAACWRRPGSPLCRTRAPRPAAWGTPRPRPRPAPGAARARPARPRPPSGPRAAPEPSAGGRAGTDPGPARRHGGAEEAVQRRRAGLDSCAILGQCSPEWWGGAPIFFLWF